jgi:hypothetical protein
VRATVLGWTMAGGVLGAVTGLVAFGALSDGFDAFGPAALLIAIPAGVTGIVLFGVPETKGRELEDLEREGALSS